MGYLMPSLVYTHTHTHTHTHIYIYIYIYTYIYMICLCVRVYDISNFVGYLMPNPFYTNEQFYFKQFSLD